EANHAAALREVVEIADREHVVAPERAQDLLQLRRLRGADVKNVTARRLRDAAQAAHDHRPAVDPLARDRLIERAAERIIAQHPDHDRGALIREGRGRPVDELREVEEKDGLDLLRRGPGTSRVRPGLRRPDSEQAGSDDQRRGCGPSPSSQKSHVTRPKTLRSIALRSPGPPKSTWLP